MTGSRTGLALAIAAGALLLHPLGGGMQTASAQTIKTTEHAEHGAYIADESGMSLYLFEEDRQEGDRGRSVETDCLDDCLGRWPPVSADDMPKAEGEADASLIDSFERPDGMTQATYNGWPIYYFVEDAEPGDVNGHDLEEFGGEWYLLTPAGNALGEEIDDDHGGNSGHGGGG